MQRRKIGFITLVLLGMSLLVVVFPFENRANAQQFQAAFLRVGLVMGAWWLAYGELQKLPRWLLWLVPLAVILAASTKRFLPVAFVCVIVAVLINLRLPGKARER